MWGLARGNVKEFKNPLTSNLGSLISWFIVSQSTYDQTGCQLGLLSSSATRGHKVSSHWEMLGWFINSLVITGLSSLALYIIPANWHWKSFCMMNQKGLHLLTVRHRCFARHVWLFLVYWCLCWLPWLYVVLV